MSNSLTSDSSWVIALLGLRERTTFKCFFTSWFRSSIGIRRGSRLNRGSTWTKSTPHGLSFSEALEFTKVDVMEGVKVALEANGVELTPTRYPSKGVCDRAGVFFSDES